MPVDVSSYQQTPTSPFDTLGKLTSIQSQANQNKLFQQEYNSKLGLSQIYKDAVDPSTGQFDPQKIPGLINGPNGANITLGLPQAIQNSQEAQTRNLGIESSKIKLAQQHIDALNNYMAPLLASPNPSSNDVVATISHAMQSGLVSQPEAVQFYSTLPRDQSGKIDESQIKPWLQHNQMQLMSAQERLTALNPTPTMVTTPQGQTPYSMPQIGTPHPVGAMIPNVPGPTTQRYNPDTRQMEYVGNLPSGGTAPGGGLAPGTAASAPFGTTEDSSRSVQAFNNLQDRNTTAPIRINQIREALSGIRSAPTGPGTDYVNAVKRFAITQAPEISKSIGINADEVVSRDKADKYMTQYANNASAAFGPSTDARLASTITGNANSHIANLAADQVLVANMALEKMAQTQAAAFLATGKPKAGFLDWSSKWNNAADVRGFMLEDMPAKERIDMLTKLKKSKPGEYNNVMNSFQAAVDAGIIQPSNIPK